MNATKRRFFGNFIGKQLAVLALATGQSIVNNQLNLSHLPFRSLLSEGTTKLREEPKRKVAYQGISRDRNGTLLIIVLVTIVLLSLSAYTFMALMQTEEEATRLKTRQLQSKYLVDSGLDYTRMFLTQSENTIREKGGRWDNNLEFQAIPVAVQQSNPDMIGYFSVVTSSLDDDGNPDGMRFGLVDESSKINLNTLLYIDARAQMDTSQPSAAELLMALPEMTEEIADAILDWLDADEEVRPYGTESSYYQGESPAYQCKNGPMDSLDELLLVRDVTPQLMFGLDTNRNGMIDQAELSANDASGADADMYLGWANYLTLYSKETNLTSEGLPRINVNSDDLEQLYDDLKSAFNDEWANYIILYRTAVEEPSTDVPTKGDGTPVDIQNAALFPIDFSNPTFESGPRKFSTIIDLIDAYVNLGDLDTENMAAAAYVQSPVRSENLFTALPTLMATLTTYEGTNIPGRINIMEAPRTVLLGLPEMDDDTVDRIIFARGDDQELDDPDGADLNRRYETWLLQEGIVDLPLMKTLMTYVCTSGSVYRAEIVGYFPDGAGTSRAEVVFDTTTLIPTILLWRNKSHLRGGFTIDALGTNLTE